MLSYSQYWDTIMLEHQTNNRIYKKVSTEITSYFSLVSFTIENVKVIF